MIVLLLVSTHISLSQSMHFNHETFTTHQMKSGFHQKIGFAQDDRIPVEGDSCYHYFKGVKGKCLNPNRCPEVLANFNLGIQPQICSYNGNTPIVCCTGHETTATTDNAPNLAHQTFGSSNSRISVQKCEQYSKLAVERDVVGSFSLDEQISTTIEKPKCVFSSGGADGFIVGGTITKPGEYPHMAVVGWQEADGFTNWNCGGSLISYRFILTAAHCASNRGIPPNVVRLGEQNLIRTDDGAYAQDYEIEKIVKHPSFENSKKYFDIALLKLDQKVLMGDFVRPACLWQSNFLNYTSLTATGWGLIREKGSPSNDLLKVSLKLITNERCNSLFERYNSLRLGIIDSQLCAGDDVEERDTCNGDSG